MQLFNKLALVLVLCIPEVSLASQWTKAWEITGVLNPESVVYDASRETIFVSNQNYEGKPGSASIGKLSLEGKIIENEWVKGLTKPKGIAILGNKLFVSDYKSLVEIDIKQAKIVKRYSLEEIEFLNDVAISDAGEVYVAEMFNSAIYRLDKEGNFKLWLKSKELENPNGLLAVGDKLYVSGWGRFDNKQPKTAKWGSFIEVNLKSKKIKKLTKKPIGNLDGVQVFEEGRFLVSDWINGDIHLSDLNNNFVRILDLEPSSGDIAYIREKNLLLIPMAKQGTVQAYEKPKQTN